MTHHSSNSGREARASVRVLAVWSWLMIGRLPGRKWRRQARLLRHKHISERYRGGIPVMKRTVPVQSFFFLTIEHQEDRQHLPHPFHFRGLHQNRIVAYRRQILCSLLEQHIVVMSGFSVIRALTAIFAWRRRELWNLHELTFVYQFEYWFQCRRTSLRTTAVAFDPVDAISVQSTCLVATLLWVGQMYRRLWRHDACIEPRRSWIAYVDPARMPQSSQVKLFRLRRRQTKFTTLSRS